MGRIKRPTHAQVFGNRKISSKIPGYKVTRNGWFITYVKILENAISMLTRIW